MQNHQQKEEALRCNLQDAGCPQDVIHQFLKNHKDNNISEQLFILSEQRKRQLFLVHTEQNKLECLDYLIYHIKKSCHRSIRHPAPPANR